MSGTFLSALMPAIHFVSLGQNIILCPDCPTDTDADVDFRMPMSAKNHPDTVRWDVAHPNCPRTTLHTGDIWGDPVTLGGY